MATDNNGRNNELNNNPNKDYNEESNNNLDNGQYDDQGYNFIEEKVASRKKHNIKKFIHKVILVIILGAIFGLTAGVVLSVTEEPINNIFGKDKKVVEFTSDENGSEIDPNESIGQDNGEIESGATASPEETSPTIINNTIEAGLDDLASIYSEVRDLGDQTSKSIVLVTSIKSDQDWFQNEIEVPDDTSGLIVGNNGLDILVLVNYNRVQGANTIEVTFNGDIAAEATLQSFDSEINLAIIAISLADLPEEIHDIESASLGESSYLPLGTPIVALGSPNGYMGSMEIGMISSKGTKAYITDHQIDLYHTDINYVEDGEGYIVNLKGDIIGIVTTHLSDNRNEEINTFIGISSIKSMIESLVNNESRAYLGIKTIDITDDALEELELENGIAVTAVQANSPAFYSGIQVGDIIIRINEEDVLSVKNFQSRLSDAKPEDMVDIEIHREYQTTSDIIEVETMLETRQF